MWAVFLISKIINLSFFPYIPNSRLASSRAAPTTPPRSSSLPGLGALLQGRTPQAGRSHLPSQRRALTLLQHDQDQAGEVFGHAGGSLKG